VHELYLAEAYIPLFAAFLLDNPSILLRTQPARLCWCTKSAPDAWEPWAAG